MEALTSLQPETQLLALIDQYILANQHEWIGTAEALEKRLTSDQTWMRSQSTEAFLLLQLRAELCWTFGQIHPERVHSTSSKGKTTWHIKPVEAL